MGQNGGSHCRKELAESAASDAIAIEKDSKCRDADDRDEPYPEVILGILTLLLDSRRPLLLA
jgi:hypothetical protein